MNSVTMTTSLRRALRTALCALLPILLAACGGGGGGNFAAGGIVGTGSLDVVVIGEITAVDSSTVTVNGTAYTTTGATIRVNGPPATAASLRVGMVVTVQAMTQPGGAAAATSVEYKADVAGVVTGVDSASSAFTLLGQLVRTDKATVFDGGTFDTLLNQYVEVSGFRSAPGELLATRVAIHATALPGALVEVVGTVAALDPNAKTFTLGTQLVDYAGVPAAFLPTGLANGALADVHGTVASGSGTLVATSIEIVPTGLPAPDSSQVEIEGLITDFAGVASFKVNGQPVNGNAATIEGGTAAALGNGVKVEVEGKLTAGVVVAAKIAIEEEVDVVLDGVTDSIDMAASSVTVAGQQVLVTTTTEFEDKSAAAVANFNLGAVHVGDRLSVRAAHSAKKLVAKRIERLDPTAPPPSKASASAEGVISDFVSAANFKVGTRSINASSAKFDNGVAADLANGVRVEVEGTLSAGVLMASKVEFKSAGTPPALLDVKGTITDFVSKASFKVAGQPVDASGAAFEGGTPADLANGLVVEASGTLAGGVLVAVKVAIEGASAPMLDVEGSITDFVSVANFKVAGQAIDASGATIKNGKASDLGNGRTVEVAGPLVAGVLKATSVELKDTNVDDDAEAHGKIANFVSAASFQVAGRTIDASSASFENGTAAKLANGVQVEVEGKLVGAILVAKKVSFDD